MRNGHFDGSLLEVESAAVVESAKPRFLDQALFVVAFLVNIGIWTITPHEDPTVGSPIAQSVLGSIYLTSILGVIAERKAAFKILRGSLPIVLIVLLAVVSTIWSDEPFTTLRRSFELLGTCAFSLYFVCRLGVKGFLEAFAIAMTIAALLAAALIAFVPDIGLMQEAYAGAWRGFFPHKNALGLAMVLGMLTIGVLAQASHGARRTAWIAAFLLMLGLFIGTQSITAAIAALFLLLIIPILLRSRVTQSRRPAIVMSLVMTAVVVISLVSGFGIDELLAAFGRDSTLTGRTELWQAVIDAIQQRPFLGYGYNAFFTAHQVVSWDAPHAHNGLLEATLNYGLIGVILVLLVFYAGIRRAWPLFWSGRDLVSAWPLFVLLFTFATNVSEDAFAESDFRWIGLVAAYFLAVKAYQWQEQLDMPEAASAIGIGKLSLR